MSGEFVLLWSQRQNAVRIIPVAQMLDEAMRDYRDDRAGDYRPLVIGERLLCRLTAENIAATLDNREPVRGLRLVRGGAA